MSATNELYSGLAADVAPGSSSLSQHDGEGGKLASVTNNNFERVNRPMNSFMIWSKGQLPNITQEDAQTKHPDISNRLGAERKLLSVAEKGPLVEEANRLRAVLMGEQLDYKFPSKRQESAGNRPDAGQQDSGHQELQVQFHSTQHPLPPRDGILI